jgi:hypothetical protein
MNTKEAINSSTNEEPNQTFREYAVMVEDNKGHQETTVLTLSPSETDSSIYEYFSSRGKKVLSYRNVGRDEAKAICKQRDETRNKFKWSDVTELIKWKKRKKIYIVTIIFLVVLRLFAGNAVFIQGGTWLMPCQAHFSSNDIPNRPRPFLVDGTKVEVLGGPREVEFQLPAENLTDIMYEVRVLSNAYSGQSGCIPAESIGR